MADYTNSVATIMPGMGSGSFRVTSLDNNQAAGTSTYTLNTPSGFQNRCGKVRVRTKGSTANPPAQSATGVTTTSLVITVTDGTRTYVIFTSVGGIGTANQNLDITTEYNVDILVTSLVATLITAVGAVFVDVEWVGGP